MSKKQIIKEVFDKEFDIEKMRNQILINAERNEKKFMIKFLRYSLPVCLIMIICGVLVFHNNNSSSILKENDTPIDNCEKNIMNVNKIEDMGLTSLDVDADIKEIPSNGINIPWPDILKDGITIPKDLDKLNHYAIYTRKNQSSEYDVLNCYVYRYYNENKDIRIAFSNTNKPIRDYYFEEVGKISKMKETELTIYQYENTYFTEFKYKGYYFDIETNDISIEELTALLESIIQ